MLFRSASGAIGAQLKACKPGRTFPESSKAPIDPLSEHFFLEDRVLQYVDKIIEGVYQYYVCRHKTCASFSPATQWIECEDTTHFKCPMCGEKYQPWLDRPHLMAAQMVQVMAPCVDIPEISMKAGQLHFFLLEWPDTKTCVLRNRFKEIFLGISEQAKRSPTDALLGLIREKAAAADNLSFFSKKELSKATTDKVDHANWGAKYKYHYQHLLGGFQSARIAYKEDIFIMSSEDSVRLWAYSKYVLECRVMRGRL